MPSYTPAERRALIESMLLNERLEKRINEFVARFGRPPAYPALPDGRVDVEACHAKRREAYMRGLIA